MVGQGVVGAVRVLVFTACLVSLSGCGFPRPADIGSDDAAAGSGGNGPADGNVCFGSFLRTCLASTPTMPFTVSAASNVDTDSPLCASTVSGATNYCVIAATNITIAATLRATGKKPLVLIATDSIVTTGMIDVTAGAGSNPGACTVGTRPAGGGGYAGGSFVGLGGAGGFGSDGGAAGMPAASVTDVTELRGGCSGQNDGSGVLAYGVGGGAVFLIAGNRIDIRGGINASGQGGGAGQGLFTGGYGGGAGGMIGFEAPIITCNSLLLAAGGGGGGGSSGPFEGHNGSTPDSITPAAGGGGVSGGQGGSGSTPSRGSPGMAGSPGLAGNPPGAGGGGGGGAGLIKAPATANLGTMVSPLPTP